MQTKCVAIWQQVQRRRHMNEGIFSSCVNGVSCLAKLWDSPTGSRQEEATQFCITESTRKDASPGGFGGVSRLSYLWSRSLLLWFWWKPSPRVLGATFTPTPSVLWICSRIHLCWIFFFPPSARQSEPWGREACSCGTCIGWERIVQGSNPNSVLGTLSVTKQASWVSEPHTPYL